MRNRGKNTLVLLLAFVAVLSLSSCSFSSSGKARDAGSDPTGSGPANIVNSQVSGAVDFDH